MCKHPWPSIADIPDSDAERERRRKIIETAKTRAQYLVGRGGNTNCDRTIVDSRSGTRVSPKPTLDQLDRR
jgi:hypothetical protein